jgi:hypothetical protein
MQRYVISVTYSVNLLLKYRGSKDNKNYVCVNVLMFIILFVSDTNIFFEV